MEPNTWLWILAGFLAAIFVGTGLLKLTTPRDRLVASGMGWAREFSQEQIRLIGIAEVLGAIGLVVPPLLGIVPLLSPVAASCLALGMAGATAVHIRRREFLPDALRSLAVVVLCVVLAAYRFGPQPF
ncbi:MULTISPECIES: DoxX family protein [unclassified Nocardioides]|uniref:DoxX family protein n=1 Tax=unclassified Nocardioides TaxID=2615069 RepID=UPI000A26E55D|nr:MULTISPECIES: DoxX family protein [unclassified Nocardioides]